MDHLLFIGVLDRYGLVHSSRVCLVVWLPPPRSPRNGIDRDSTGIGRVWPGVSSPSIHTELDCLLARKEMVKGQNYISRVLIRLNLDTHVRDMRGTIHNQHEGAEVIYKSSLRCSVKFSLRDGSLALLWS